MRASEASCVGRAMTVVSDVRPRRSRSATRSLKVRFCITARSLISRTRSSGNSRVVFTHLSCHIAGLPQSHHDDELANERERLNWLHLAYVPSPKTQLLQLWPGWVDRAIENRVSGSALIGICRHWIRHAYCAQLTPAPAACAASCARVQTQPARRPTARRRSAPRLARRPDPSAQARPADTR